MPNVTLSTSAYASVDTSGLGRTKTVFVPDGFNGRLILQASNNNNDWADVAMVNSGQQTLELDFFCRYMRINPSRSFSNGGDVSIFVAADAPDDTVDFATVLNVPSSNGTGTTSDLTALGSERSIIVAGDFSGRVLIEGLVEGIPEVLAFFEGQGVKHISGNEYDLLRVRRVGNTSGTPVVSVGCGVEGGAAAGVETVVAGSGITVDDSDPANPVVSATGGSLIGAVTQVSSTTGNISLANPVTVFSNGGARTIPDGTVNGQDKWVRNPVDGTISATLAADVANHLKDPASGVIAGVNFAAAGDWVHLKWNTADTSWQVVNSHGVTFSMDT